METEQRAKAFCPVFLLPSIRQKGPVDLEEKACIIGENDGIPGIPLTKTGH